MMDDHSTRHAGFHTHTDPQIPRIRNFLIPLGLVWIPAAWCFDLPSARADQIILRGGGQVQGKVAPDPNDPDRVQIWLLNGKNPLSFQKQQILQTIAKPSPLDEYLIKRAQAASDPQAQYELGLWCEQNKLSGLAQAHFEAAVTRDKSFEPAHQKLGHVLHDGHWLTHDELRSVQGLIKYKGKWITPEEKSQLESNVKMAGEQTSMVRRIRLLRQALLEGSGDRRREAEAQLMQLREPVAVTPLTRVFGNDIPERRKLLIQILGGIEGPEASSALVARLLIEPESDVRHAALEQLKDRKERNIEFQLTRALHSSNNAVINRAAWAIGHLGMVSAVPKLIPALLSTEERSVWTNSDGAVMGGGGTPYAAGLSTLPSPTYPGGGALLADNGSSIAILTPPAVGPGAVAYGATVVPYYYGPGIGVTPPDVPVIAGNEFAPVSSLSSPNRGPVLRPVFFAVENIEVHDALVSLTTKDFEYNTASWKNWLNREFKPNPDPVRRVPQP